MYHHNKIIGRANQERVIAYKVDKGCKNCGNKHPAVLQFHHPDSTTKTYKGTRRTSERPYRLTWKWETIQTELDKLDVLCANCHLIRHYQEK